MAIGPYNRQGWCSHCKTFSEKVFKEMIMGVYTGKKLCKACVLLHNDPKVISINKGGERVLWI